MSRDFIGSANRAFKRSPNRDRLTRSVAPGFRVHVVTMTTGRGFDPTSNFTGTLAAMRTKIGLIPFPAGPGRDDYLYDVATGEAALTESTGYALMATPQLQSARIGLTSAPRFEQGNAVKMELVVSKVRSVFIPDYTAPICVHEFSARSNYPQPFGTREPYNIACFRSRLLLPESDAAELFVFSRDGTMAVLEYGPPEIIFTPEELLHIQNRDVGQTAAVNRVRTASVDFPPVITGDGQLIGTAGFPLEDTVIAPCCDLAP
jgi:hypothetical protein